MIKKETQAVICLGANTPDADKQIHAARVSVSALCDIISISGIYPTAPEYAGESTPYLNEVIVLKTRLTLSAFQQFYKEYEKVVRAQNKHEGLVNIDIDVVIWDNNILRPRDYNASYFREGIRRIGLDIDKFQTLDAIGK